MEFDDIEYLFHREMMHFLVGGFGRQPLYDEMGAAARDIHCYTVIGFW